jgi:hypothetical protein
MLMIASKITEAIINIYSRRSKMKYLDIDWLLVLVAVISIIIAYFIVTTSERGEEIAIQQCEILFEKMED